MLCINLNSYLYCCCVSIIILICICPPGALIWLINLFFLFIFNIFIQFLHFLLIAEMQTFVHKCRVSKDIFFRKFQITFHKILKTFRLTLFRVDRCFTIDEHAVILKHKNVPIPSFLMNTLKYIIFHIFVLQLFFLLRFDSE